MVSLRDEQSSTHLTRVQLDRKISTARVKEIANRKTKAQDGARTPFTAKVPVCDLQAESRWPNPPETLDTTRAKTVKGIKEDWLHGAKLAAVRKVNAGTWTDNETGLSKLEKQQLACAVPNKLYLESTPMRQKALQSLTVPDLEAMSKKGSGHFTLREQKGKCSHFLTFVNLSKETKIDLRLYMCVLRPFFSRSCQRLSDMPDIEVRVVFNVLLLVMGHAFVCGHCRRIYNTLTTRMST
jgi:hypothetical protein